MCNSLWEAPFLISTFTRSCKRSLKSESSVKAQSITLHLCRQDWQVSTVVAKLTFAWGESAHIGCFCGAKCPDEWILHTFFLEIVYLSCSCTGRMGFFFLSLPLSLDILKMFSSYFGLMLYCFWCRSEVSGCGKNFDNSTTTLNCVELCANGQEPEYFLNCMIQKELKSKA